MEVRSAIQTIALEHRRRYGYRRITAELHRRGMHVNHKRVARIMREDNLLGVQPERFVVTTNSNHKLEIYLNLASRMKLTGVNQLWVADITYIRLKAEFVYLAVILDRFSRKVVGWALDRTLGNRLAVGALEQALEKRQPPPGLVHHLRTKRTTERFLKGCWGKGLKCRPLPQTPSPAECVQDINRLLESDCINCRYVSPR